MKDYVVSLALIRNTTGTLVHGKIAISVTTAVTKSGGVTSYNKLNGVNFATSFHFFNAVGMLMCVTLNASGFPKKH